jgi:imidazole glycerol-phosphate synthase subunit HisF
MLRTRVIPCLLLQGRGLVKTVKFTKPKYLGDPINVVKIFNDKQVDELVMLDITATLGNHKPQFNLIAQVASECFMPLGYGGGIRSLDDVRALIHLGIEKVVINSYAVEDPAFIHAVSEEAGAQAVVVSLDVKKDWRGKYELFTRSGRQSTGIDPIQFASEMQKQGAGELLLNSIDRDGTQQGYDVDLVKRVANAVDIPVVACGGARNVSDLAAVVKQGGASAAAAGSLFVFKGPRRAVLINFPTPQELSQAFAS